MVPMTRRAGPELYPDVRFEPGFVARLERLAARLSLARERKEGGGVPSMLGAGSEFVGYRPYARGDDLRGLDWDVFARSRRPYVRVARRDAGESWLVRLDASASMGVGPPGKLQRAAEIAAGLAAIGLREGAEVRVEAGGRAFTARRRRALPEICRFLETVRAGGAETALRKARVARIVLVGDLGGVAPADALRLAGRGRALSIVHVLAPVEIEPPRDASVEWWDPEKDERLALGVDERTARAYEAELEREIELWHDACARHGVPYAFASTALPMEAILERVALA
jgi:uncharacterized protein (DUF58 family)